MSKVPSTWSREPRFMDFVVSMFLGQLPGSDCHDRMQAVAFLPSSVINHASGFVSKAAGKPAAFTDVRLMRRAARGRSIRWVGKFMLRNKDIVTSLGVDTAVG